MIGVNVTFVFCKKTYFLFNVFNQKTAVSPHHRRNLTSVSNHGKVYEAAPISLSWAPNGLSEFTRNAFRISFHPDWPIDNGLFNKPRWGPRTRIWVLFLRRT